MSYRCKILYVEAERITIGSRGAPLLWSILDNKPKASKSFFQKFKNSRKISFKSIFISARFSELVVDGSRIASFVFQKFPNAGLLEIDTKTYWVSYVPEATEEYY